MGGPQPDDAAATIARLNHELGRERARTQALREVGLLLDSSLDKDELLRRILAAAKRVAEAERATLYVLEDDGRTLASHATEGGQPTKIVLPMTKGIAGAAATEKQTVNIADAYLDDRFDRGWDTKTGFRTRAVLAAPMLTADGRLVGVLQVLNRRDSGPFDQDDVATLEALAAQAAVALEAANTLRTLVERNRALSELRTQLERSLHERQLLLEIEQLLSRVDTMEEFFHGTLEQLLRACSATAGCIALTDHATGLSTYRAVLGTSEVAIDTAVSEQTPLARAVLRDEVMFACETTEDEMPEAVLVVPLPGEDGRSRGAIELRARERTAFSQADREIVELVAANVTTGVELSQARIERERGARLATIGRTLANVLHDIRTPMTIISGYAQLMPDIESVDERRKYAKSIVRQFELVQAMIAELLAFVRGESGALFQRVPLQPFFEEVVELLQRDMSARNVTVKLQLHERGAVRMDPAKITRMVHNLARNAADAMAGRTQPGLFVLTVSREGEQLVLSFEDNGPGIPESVRQKLFESFVTQGKRDGTGLGLAIVKKVVDDHNGTITVDTSHEGTRFTVKIPLQSTAVLARRTAQP